MSDLTFWGRVDGYEGGLPVHLPMGLTKDGHGPEDEDPEHYRCWCGDLNCPLTLALERAWQAGRKAEARDVAYKWQWGAWADVLADAQPGLMGVPQAVTDWLRGRIR